MYVEEGYVYRNTKDGKLVRVNDIITMVDTEERVVSYVQLDDEVKLGRGVNAFLKKFEPYTHLRPIDTGTAQEEEDG